MAKIKSLMNNIFLEAMKTKLYFLTEFSQEMYLFRQFHNRLGL